MKRAGTARPSLIGKLLDEYEASGTADIEHEYDLKVIGAVMYAGKSFNILNRYTLAENFVCLSAGSETVSMNSFPIFGLWLTVTIFYIRVQRPWRRSSSFLLNTLNL